MSEQIEILNIEQSQAEKINVINLEQIKIVSVEQSQKGQIDITEIEESQSEKITIPDPNSTTGKDGADGKSAYQIWLDLGNTGSEADFIASLKGTGGTSTWDEIQNKPTTFTPSTHTQDISTINGLQSALNKKLETETDPIYTADKPAIALKSEIPDISVKADKTETYTKTEVDNKISSVVSGASDASEVSYSNTNYPTVQSALDKLLYVNPTVSISGGGTYEVGQTISSVTLNWSYNKTMVSQSLNNSIGSLDKSLRTYTHSGQSITSNRTYTITANDGTNSVSASTTIAFAYKRYWGASANASLSNSDILSLNSEFSSSRFQSRTFDCSGGKYFYFIIPTSNCSGISFKVGGLSYSDLNVQTINFTNASGNTSSYNVYRSGNIQTGSSILVEIN